VVGRGGRVSECESERGRRRERRRGRGVMASE
jgi:hypothetical protein